MPLPTSPLSGPSDAGAQNNSTDLTTSSDSSGVDLSRQGGIENIRRRHNISFSPSDPLPPDENTLRINPAERGADTSSATFPLQMTPPANDRLYFDSVHALLMRSVPKPTLPLTQQILLLNWELELRDSERQDGLLTVCEILGLDLSLLLGALSELHSILIVPESKFLALKFHHNSFMEFLLDVNRSGEEFWIRCPELYGSLLKRAVVFIKGFETWEIPSGEFITARQGDYIFVANRVQWWIQFAKMDEEIVALFASVDFTKHSPYLHKVHELLEARLRVYGGQLEPLQPSLTAEVAEVAEER